MIAGLTGCAALPGVSSAEVRDQSVRDESIRDYSAHEDFEGLLLHAREYIHPQILSAAHISDEYQLMALRLEEMDIFWTFLYPGLDFTFVELPEFPLRVFALRIDTARPEITIAVTPPEMIGLRTTRYLSAHETREHNEHNEHNGKPEKRVAIAAVNATPYGLNIWGRIFGDRLGGGARRKAFNPSGLWVHDGELLSPPWDPEWWALFIDAQGRVSMGPQKVPAGQYHPVQNNEGQNPGMKNHGGQNHADQNHGGQNPGMKNHWDDKGDGKAADAWGAVGGYRPILMEGENVGIDYQRHPRTAAGLDRTERYLYLLVADGRNVEWSRGATSREMGLILQTLGGYEGFNLDGGGSSAMALRNYDGSGALVNRPASGLSGRKERPVALHIAVLLTAGETLSGPSVNH